MNPKSQVVNMSIFSASQNCLYLTLSNQIWNVLLVHAWFEHVSFKIQIIAVHNQIKSSGPPGRWRTQNLRFDRKTEKKKTGGSLLQFMHLVICWDIHTDAWFKIIHFEGWINGFALEKNGQKMVSCPELIGLQRFRAKAPTTDYKLWIYGGFLSISTTRLGPEKQFCFSNKTFLIMFKWLEVPNIS